MMRIGGFWSSIVRTCTGLVWVRSSMGASPLATRSGEPYELEDFRKTVATYSATVDGDLPHALCGWGPGGGVKTRHYQQPEPLLVRKLHQVPLPSCFAEWTNPATLGGAAWWDKGLMAGFASVSPRTAGFNSIDVASMTDVGLLGTMVLMFIGAGSAGTSGGIKVGTFSVLALLVWSQLRGTDDVTVFRRRISGLVQREATTVILLGFASVVMAVVVLLGSSPFPLRDAAFEAVSAFGTVGLSTGITPLLGGVSQLALVAIMLIGRVGPVTLGMALVLKRRDARVRYPEEAPLIG